MWKFLDDVCGVMVWSFVIATSYSIANNSVEGLTTVNPYFNKTVIQQGKAK